MAIIPVQFNVAPLPSLPQRRSMGDDLMALAMGLISRQRGEQQLPPAGQDDEEDEESPIKNALGIGGRKMAPYDSSSMTRNAWIQGAIQRLPPINIMDILQGVHR